MEQTLFNQGLTLMLVGMGTVFVFLSLLVAGMSLMATIVKHITPVAAESAASDEEIAAITAAIVRHRNK